MNREQWFRIALVLGAGSMLVTAASFPSGARAVPVATASIIVVLGLVLFAQDLLVARKERTAAVLGPEDHGPTGPTGLPEGLSALIAEKALAAEDDAPAPDAATEAADRRVPSARKRAVLMVMTALYPLASIAIGFTLGTFIFLVAALLYLGTGKVRAVGIAAVTSVAVYLFFTELLSAPIVGGLLVPLP